MFLLDGFGGVVKSGLNVFLCQMGIVLEDLLVVPAVRDQFQEELPKPGDMIKVLIEDVEDIHGLVDDSRGMITLSKRKAEKIEAWLKVMEGGKGSFDDFMWKHVDHKTIVNHWTIDKKVPASTPVSDALSKDLIKRGFKFVGSTICYAHMQAVGMVNDHLVTCFRHGELT